MKRGRKSFELGPAPRSTCDQVADFIPSAIRDHDAGSSSRQRSRVAKGSSFANSHPLLTSRVFPFAMRFSSSEAGSSFASCGTSLPRTARLRMVWRRALIWSGRVVSAGSASRAKRALAWNVSGSGALRRARLAAASRSRAASRLARAASSRSHSPSTHRPWRRCGAARRAVGGERANAQRYCTIGIALAERLPVISGCRSSMSASS